LRLEGNSLHQDYGFSYAHKHSADGLLDHAILLNKVKDVKISNVYLNNTMAGGIFLFNSSNIMIRDCTITKVAYRCWLALYTTDQTWTAIGISMYGCNQTSIIGCHLSEIYASGIVFEAMPPSPIVSSSPRYYYSTNFVVSSCVIKNCFCGIWLEESNDGMVSNCIISNATWNGSYLTKTIRPLGVRMVTSYNITAIGCIVKGCGDKVLNRGCGFLIANENVNVVNCQIEGTYGDGITFAVESSNDTVSGCFINSSSRNGTNVYGLFNTITDCVILNSGRHGIRFYSNSPTITNNRITNFGSTYNGIYSSVSAVASRQRNKYGSIIGNTIESPTNREASQRQVERVTDIRQFPECR